MALSLSLSLTQSGLRTHTQHTYAHNTHTALKNTRTHTPTHAHACMHARTSIVFLRVDGYQ